MFHVIIPARYAATRLPGKPLVALGGKTMLQWVWERASASGAASVTVAVDDARIAEAAARFGADYVMTSPHHVSGTDRVAEVVKTRALAADAVIVNLQADEPLMPVAVIAAVAAALAPGIDIATASAPVATLDEFLDPNCVKALRGADGLALYFSRAPVPWPRDHVQGDRPTRFLGARRHIGIYAYRASSLLTFTGWPPSLLETTEKLEQLRALERGMKIHVVELADAPPAGVDTIHDLERVRAFLETGQNHMR